MKINHGKKQKGKFQRTSQFSLLKEPWAWQGYFLAYEMCMKFTNQCSPPKTMPRVFIGMSSSGLVN